MAKINVLDSSIFNLISAGEVVEKPMSVVKELVENSIDAGARKIYIEVKKGGIDYIKVSDDGCGIEKSEIHKAFMPHATSKIVSISDLNSILTLGFRGEALASIAAVAKVTLTSRVENDELGYCITYDAGSIVNEYETGAKRGTTIVVENLFEKIPARQKFLRSPSTEEADIANLITRLILANPNVSFEFSGETKSISSTGENEKSALISVYGNDILSNMEEVSLIMPDITIRGFIGKPSFSKHSRNFQTLVVNGRYVKNDELFYMIYLCYKDFLMTRKYPIFVLYINLPADMVDVNVHPSKMEVKFVQPDRIKKLVMQVVNEKLKSAIQAPKMIEPQEVTSPVYNNEATAPLTAPASTPFSHSEEFEIKTVRLMPNMGIKSTLKENIAHTEVRKEGEGYFGGAAYKFATQSVETTDFLPEEEIMTIGTLFSTYIIVEQGDNCFLIDQHAAHERILYDKLVKRIDENRIAMQGLLLPHTFTLTHEESEIVDSHAEIFSACGFELNKTGDCRYEITAVPSIISEISLDKFLPMFFDAIRLNGIKQSKLIKDTLAQSACKAAVKGDRLLSQEEIRYLIKGVNTLDALLCPHGRPIAIKLTKTEIDKWFKRK